MRAANAPFDIGGSGTRAFGRPPEGARLSSAKLSGIVFYEPAEMTLRARAGTPLREVEERIAARRADAAVRADGPARAVRNDGRADRRRAGGERARRPAPP